MFISSHAPLEDIWATAVILDTKTKALDVEFNTGESFRYPAELLRVESPSADAQRTVGDRPKIVHGRRHVGILDVEPVGRYALRIQFDDLHGSGLFTWSYLYDLGGHKYHRIKRYLKALRQNGLSRDPAPRKARVKVKESKESGGE